MLEGNERFEIRRRLGEGGMGVVYEAYDHERTMSVALKTLRRINPATVYRFKREFRLLTGVSHPNLVSLYELLSIDGEWLFTMELIDGVDFVSYVCGVETRPSSPTLTTLTGLDPRDDDSQPPTAESPSAHAYGLFDEQRLRSALRQLCEGVEALHETGHLHQDIKPSNVLVAADERVVLLDFGVITELGAPAWRGGTASLGGTPAYMAPERYGSDPSPSKASDWYSVGVMLFQVLAGTKPFVGSEKMMRAAKLVAPPPAPRAHRLGVPSDLNDLCVALLDPDPDARPSGTEILAILRRGGQVDTTEAITPEDQPTQLFGRAAQQAELRAAVLRSHDAPTIAFVSGSSGMGKSALMRAFADELMREGEALVLAGRCYERETVPYKAVDSVIDSLYRFLIRQAPSALRQVLPRDIALLARVFPVLGQLASMVDAPAGNLPGPHELRERAFVALRELLCNVSARRTVVVAIDDLQWGDAESAHLLDAVMRPPGAPALLLAVTYRTEDAAASPAVTELLRHSADWAPAVHTVHIEVGALSDAEARELAGHLMSRDPDSTTVRAVIADAGGHPYLIHELADFAGGGSANDSMDASISLDRLLATRVGALDGTARQLLELVAVAGRPTRQIVIQDAGDLSRADRLTVLQTLESARMVRLSGLRDLDTVAVYHSRIRETVNENLDAEALTQHHHRLALAIERSEQADAETLTSHFIGAGKPERAAHYAAIAGHHAADSLAFDRAAQLFRTALELGRHEPERRHELELALASALAYAARGPEAADAYLTAAANASPLERLNYRREAARQLLVSGHLERGLSTIQELLDAVEVPYPASPRRALLGLLGNRARLRLRGLRWKSRSADDIPASQLARLDVEQSVADGLAMIDNIRGSYFQTRALLLSLRLGEETRIVRALGRESVFLSSQGGRGVARAQQCIALMREINERIDEPWSRAWTFMAEGCVAYFSGRFRAAEAHFDDAEELLRADPAGSSLELTNARLFRLFAFRRLGAFAICRRLADAFVRDAERRGDRYGETTMRRASNLLLLVADQPDEAERDLDRTSWTPPDAGFHLQHWYELEARGELALYRGEGASALNERFDAVSRSLVTRVQFVRVVANGLRARLRVQQAKDGQGLREVARLTRSLRSEGVGYANAWALLLDAALLLRGKGAGPAADMLAKAAAVAEANGLQAHAEVARRRRGQLLGGADGEALISAADDALRKRGVVDVERFSRVLAPGFDPDGK